MAVEQFGAGPWSTLQLAALGATVVKVEDPTIGGDVGRYVVPFQSGETSLFFETFNRGKEYVSLNLRRDQGRAAFHRLVSHSDVVFCNLRGDLPDRLGLTFDRLRVVNPTVVCCSLSGFGRSGPRVAQGTYDYAIQGHAGWMSLTGEPGGPPAKSGMSLVDFSTGFAAAIAILAGLHRAARSGTGCDCEVSLFEVALALNTYVATWVLSGDWPAERLAHSAHPSLVPFQLFPAADGWLVICCGKDALFRRMCGVVGLEWMLDDDRFATIAARQVNRDECVQAVAGALRARPAAEWLAALEAAGVPCGPINDVASAFRDPQVAARDGIDEYDHPELGRVRTPAPPIRVAGHRSKPERAPRPGEHTRPVLRDLCGYSDAEIDELVRDGIVAEAV